jgi:hypothetical protein
VKNFIFSPAGNLLSFGVSDWSGDMINTTSKNLLFQHNNFDVLMLERVDKKYWPDSKKVYV